MLKIIISFLFLLSQALADSDDCQNEITQGEKSHCMTYERNLAIGELMKKVTIRCSKNPEIKVSKGGSLYPLLLDECIEKEITKISEELE